jgi:hypothetical protein
LDDKQPDSLVVSSDEEQLILANSRHCGHTGAALRTSELISIPLSPHVSTTPWWWSPVHRSARLIGVRRLRNRPLGLKRWCRPPGRGYNQVRSTTSADQHKACALPGPPTLTSHAATPGYLVALCSRCNSLPTLGNIFLRRASCGAPRQTIAVRNVHRRRRGPSTTQAGVAQQLWRPTRGDPTLVGRPSRSRSRCNAPSTRDQYP